MWRLAMARPHFHPQGVGITPLGFRRLDPRRDFPYRRLTPGAPRMITSKLTSKAQTTIPQAVRNALGVRPGDEIAYAVADGRVLLTKAAKPRRGAPFEDPFAVFGEWDTPEDDEAFGDLWWAPRFEIAVTRPWSGPRS
jgi:antitoxin PrlF